MNAVLFLAVMLGIASVAFTARAAPWRVAPPPSWPVMAAPCGALSSPSVSEAGTGGERILLYAREVRVGKKQETFSHWTRHITNEAGLQSNSQLNIEFDPSYQTLIIHYVQVMRGADRIDELDPSAVKLVQRQPGLESQIFDSVESAVLFLRDLRVGDVVDYAYTVAGADPTMGGKYEDRFFLALPLPVEHLFARVLLDRDRALSVALRGPTLAPDPAHAPRISHDSTEYRWDHWATESRLVEASAPPWFDPVPFAVISEFQSWSEVALWGQHFFSSAPEINGPTRAWFDQNFEGRSSADFVLRAARFVQDEIRYVGIEVGIARRAANDPNSTFLRRYGDCKDKTVLLVALLKAAKIDAVPVLVSSNHGLILDDNPPLAGTFDHAIVRVALAGVDYFIDPTVSLQGGGLDRLRYSPFEHVLVLSDGASRLTPVRAEPQKQPALVIRDRLHLSEPASKAEATLDTVRTYQAAVADSLRGQLRGLSVAQRSKFYLSIYQPDYPGIHELAPIEENDDRGHDILTVSARFGVPDIWQRAPASEMQQAKISARSLQWLLPAPGGTTRATPLNVPFPMFARQDIEVELPFDLPGLSSQPAQIETRATSFGFKSSYDKRLLSYRYEIASKAGAVAVEDMVTQSASVERALGLMLRTVTYRSSSPEFGSRGVNWLILPLAVSVFVGSGVVCWWLFRAKKSIANTRHSRGAPIAFGGWLWLLLLGVSLSPALLAHGCYTDLKFILSLAQWQAITTPGAANYRPGLAFALVFEATAQLAFFNYSLVVLLTCYRKSRSFPWHYSVFILGFSAMSIIVCIALVASSSGQGNASRFEAPIRSILQAGIWITYLRRSRRVALTFTNAVKKKQATKPRRASELGSSSELT